MMGNPFKWVHLTGMTLAMTPVNNDSGMVLLGNPQNLRLLKLLKQQWQHVMMLRFQKPMLNYTKMQPKPQLMLLVWMQTMLVIPLLQRQIVHQLLLPKPKKLTTQLMRLA